MKIGVINYHFANNFGASLQCIALCEYLRKLGNDVIVIDYRPRYIREHQKPFPNPFYYAKWGYDEFNVSGIASQIKHAVIRGGHIIIDYKDAYQRYKRNKVFEKYMIENQNLSTQEYLSYKSLQTEFPKCDAYITGSDQLWNPTITHGQLDPAYFLMFAPYNSKKIAYAVSPCQLNADKHKEELVKYLDNLTSISIREAEKKLDLEKIANRRIEICIDPTLLLDSKDYEKYERNDKLPNSEYILVYAFKDTKNPDLIQKIVKQAEHTFKIPVYDISLEKISLPSFVKKVDCVSPGNFISFIKNAKFIITNSFHGTAFSIIYRKEFCSVVKSITASRMSELMLSLELDDRLITEYNQVRVQKCFENKVKYFEANACISEFREKSVSFLANSLL